MSTQINQEIQPAILEPTGDSAKNLQIIIVHFEANLDTTTEKMVQFTETRDVQGVTVEIINHQYGISGDSMRIAMGYDHPTEGWTEVRVLARGENVSDLAPIPKSGIVAGVSEGTATMPTTIKIKITYESVATSGDKPYVYVILRTWAA